MKGKNYNSVDWIDKNGNILVNRDSCKAVSAFLHDILIDNDFVDGVIFQSFAAVSSYLEVNREYFNKDHFN